MRITQKMIHTKMFKGLQKSQARLSEAQERIATSKNIRRPSDDPIGFMQIMGYHRDLHKLRQTIRNGENASTTLFQMDTTLERVGDLLLDAKNIATTMSSDTVGVDERLAAFDEVELMLDDMLQKSNTVFGGRYLFSGHKIRTQPYCRQMTAEDSTVSLSGGGPVSLTYLLPADADVTITIHNSDGDVVRTIGAGTQIAGDYTYAWDGLDDGGAPLADGDYDYEVFADFGERIEYVGDQGLIEQRVELEGTIVTNVPGSDIFGTSDSGIFTALMDLKTALEGNDADGIRDAISVMNTELENVTSVRAEIGTKIRRIEASTSELQTMEPILIGNLSHVEDVDMVMEAGEYLASQQAYETALESAGSILRLPTLLDFLR